MSEEIRKDLFERSVVISTSRSKRPGAFMDKKEREEACPFCPGNESKTEKTLFALPDKKKWMVRVFKNKFPVLNTRYFKPILENNFSRYTPCGAHEVLVETRHHDREYFNMPEHDIVLVIKALKNRYAELMKIPDVNYVTIFKNKGPRAGASLSHPHMQIIASPLFPHKISEEMHESENFFKEEKDCGHCVIMKEEIGNGKRVVAIRLFDGFAKLPPLIDLWKYERLWLLNAKGFYNLLLQHLVVYG